MQMIPLAWTWYGIIGSRSIHPVDLIVFALK